MGDVKKKKKEPARKQASKGRTSSGEHTNEPLEGEVDAAVMLLVYALLLVCWVLWKEGGWGRGRADGDA